MTNFDDIAKKIRLLILDLLYSTRSPHIGSSFSIVEILVALYFKQMNISKANFTFVNRDRLILSKGHACPALYAVLFEKGIIDEKQLIGFAQNSGSFEQHTSYDISKGMEFTSGSLGHGLSYGAGIALAAKYKKLDYNTYVIIGDGELNEGSTWENILFSGHHQLSNLIVLVDYNKIQALGNNKDILDLEPFVDKWESFNWHVQNIDGHNFEQIFNALESLSTTKANVIILNTVKGKGVSFMENQLLWHYRCPDLKEYELAKGELK